MTFACPNCGRAVSLRGTKCDGCQLSLGLVPLLKFYWGRFGKKVQDAAVVRCPNCPATIPIKSDRCPQCGHALTVESAVDSLVAPRKRRLFEWARSASPETKRRVQWMYFLFSLALLWLTMELVEKHFPGNVFLQSALAVVFLSGLGLLSAMLIPKDVIRTVTKRATALVKLALITNYLTAMLVMRMLTTTWQEQALTLAGMLITTWIAGFVLTAFVWPLKEEVAALHRDPSPTPPPTFNAANPQGRKARFD